MSQLKRPISSLRPIPENCQGEILAKEYSCNKVKVESAPCEKRVESVPCEKRVESVPCEKVRAEPTLCEKVKVESVACEKVNFESKVCDKAESKVCDKVELVKAEPSSCDPSVSTSEVVEIKKQNNKSKKWSRVALFIFWLIVLTIIFWLVFYSLVPPFVTKSGSIEPDLTKVLFSAFIFSFVILIFVWTFYLCIN